jgi:hypothetical protein
MRRPFASTPVTRPVVADHGGGFGLVDDLCAGVDGGVHQGGVESAAGPHRAVIGEAAGGRPVEFAHLLAGDHPQAADVVGIVERDLELVQCADGAGRETVAADLVATVCTLLEHDHVGTRPGRLDRRRCARGSGADHGDVDSLRTHGTNAAGMRGEKHRRAPEVTSGTIRLRRVLGGSVHPNPYADVEGALEGVGVRRCRTMMEVMGTPPPIDHGARLLEIYDHAVGEVFTYLRARCGGRALAEDLTAETLLAAVAQIHRGRVEEVTVAWLIGIARHKLIDEWRRAARRPRSEPLDDDDTAQASTIDQATCGTRSSIGNSSPT